MSFYVIVSAPTVNMIYFISCLMFLAVSSYRLLISIPRLRKALIITLNSLTVAIIYRDKKYFYTKQRLYDLWVTVPATLIWLTSTFLTLAIILGHKQIPLEAQLITSAMILPMFLMYLILDIPDSQKPGDNQIKNSRDWL